MTQYLNRKLNNLDTCSPQELAHFKSEAKREALTLARKFAETPVYGRLLAMYFDEETKKMHEEFSLRQNGNA